MKIYSLVVVLFLYANVVAMKTDNAFLPRPDQSGELSISVQPAMPPEEPVDHALQDLMEPRPPQNEHIQWVDDVCRTHGYQQGSIVHTALLRHIPSISSATVTRSSEDLSKVLLGVIEKSELLVQKQGQAISTHQGELQRQSTLFENQQTTFQNQLKEQQATAQKDNKKWACGGGTVTLAAVIAPLAPLIATMYNKIAGECAEKCAELCS